MKEYIFRQLKQNPEHNEYKQLFHKVGIAHVKLARLFCNVQIK